MLTGEREDRKARQEDLICNTRKALLPHSKLQILDIPQPDLRKTRVRALKSTMAEQPAYQSDEHILCDECDQLYKGHCPVHGPLEWIPHSKAISSAHYSPCVASLPDGLLMKESTIPEVEMGVFAARIIQKRVMFGPFQGKRVLPQQLISGQNLTFAWDLLQSGLATSVLDATEESRSNWMRYVTYARDKREQNLTAFQFCGEIYYRTFRTIYPGEELLVWFEDEYSCSIDDLPEEFSSDQVPEFACMFCRTVFAGATYLHKHHKFRCPNGPLHGTYGASRTTGLVGALFRLPVEVPDGWSSTEQELESNTRKSLSPDSHHSRRKSKPRKLARQMEEDEAWNPEQPFGPPPASFLNENFTRDKDSATLVMLPPGTRVCDSRDDSCDAEKQMLHAGTKRSAEDYDDYYHMDKQVCHEQGDDPRVSPTSQQYACGECGKTFARPTWWAKHESAHNCKRASPSARSSPTPSESPSLSKIPSSSKTLSPSKIFEHNETEPTVEKKPKMKHPRVSYRCDECGRAFACPSWLKRHKRVHGGSTDLSPTEEKPVPISHASANALDETRPHICQDCGRRFAVPAWLTRHRMVHHKSAPQTTYDPSKPFNCTICGRSFAVAYWLIRHQKMYHEEVIPPTPITPAAQSDNKDLPWKCEDCGLAFKWSSWLQRHQRNNCHGESNKKAVVTVTSKMQAPRSDAPFACERPGCGKAFATKRQYGRHRRRHLQNDILNGRKVPEEKPSETATNGPPFICPHANCGRSFGARHLYLKHKRRHLSTQPQVQDSAKHDAAKSIEKEVEPLKETTPDDAMESEKVDSESSVQGPPYTCKYCSKVFSYSLLLKRHELRHRNNENTKKKILKALNLPPELPVEENTAFPHVCEICGASFKGLHLWNRHMVKHLNDKEPPNKKPSVLFKRQMYSCEECGKKFAAASWLTRHMREHAARAESVEDLPNATAPQSQAEPVKHTCDECGRMFATSFWLTRHKREHAKRLEGVAQGITTEGSRSTHTEKHNKPSKFKRGKHTCDECGRSFAVAFWLTRHKREHMPKSADGETIEETPDQPVGVKKNGRTVYICSEPDCNREFPWPSWLVKHRRIHQRKKVAQMKAEAEVEQEAKVEEGEVTEAPAVTAIEEKEEVSKEKNVIIQSEMDTVTDMKTEQCYEVFGEVGVKQYRCKICHKTSAWHTGIVYHVRVHHTHERPFQCQICHKSFHMAGDLTKHAKRHSGEKPFPCQHCSKCFATAQQARKHANSHHTPLPYHCMGCGKRFRDRSSLWKHKLSSGPCNKVKDRRKVAHSAKPVPEKPQPPMALSGHGSTQCNICKKDFEDTGSLWGHRLRVHPDMLLGTCKKCGNHKGDGHSCQGTATRSQTKVSGAPSTRSHAKALHLTCFRCGESFSDRDEYRSHLTTHRTGEKIVCKYCGKSWLRKADLTRHLRVHTGERPYPCPECGLAFKVSDGLKRHMRSLHPNSTKPCLRVEPDGANSSEDNEIHIGENQDVEAMSSPDKANEDDTENNVSGQKALSSPSKADKDKHENNELGQKPVSSPAKAEKDNTEFSESGPEPVSSPLKADKDKTEIDASSGQNSADDADGVTEKPSEKSTSRKEYVELENIVDYTREDSQKQTENGAITKPMDGTEKAASNDEEDSTKTDTDTSREISKKDSEENSTKTDTGTSTDIYKKDSEENSTKTDTGSSRNISKNGSDSELENDHGDDENILKPSKKPEVSSLGTETDVPEECDRSANNTEPVRKDTSPSQVNGTAEEIGENVSTSIPAALGQTVVDTNRKDTRPEEATTDRPLGDALNAYSETDGPTNSLSEEQFNTGSEQVSEPEESRRIDVELEVSETGATVNGKEDKRYDTESDTALTPSSELGHEKESHIDITEAGESDTSFQASSKRGLKAKKSNAKKKVADSVNNNDAGDTSKAKGNAGRKCPYCSKLFSLPGNLARHVRLHTGERPFSCKTCGETFMRSDVMSQHIATFH
ncbi:uncharacterized protein LOC5518712 [Nematostella vectensis]|uniref:uncharacterized protein LOC5518712 n=1 Tax=Nematostella vectensis TaxID=45351 RepID=UPI00138FD061|nr:uncharacterized protein LOC5518712 [Nematostella vectensis]